VSIDYDGDGSFDQSSSDLTTPLQHDYTAAGINNVMLRITMADGSYHTAEKVVVTQGSDHYDAIFHSLWDGMNDALLANEPLLALNYLERRAQGQYFNTFRVIAPRMQSIVDSYRTPARSSVDDYYLEYIVPRAGENGNLLYYIYCVRTSDGTWRIKEM